MLAIKGIYDGESIKPIEKIPPHKQCRVVITFLDDEQSSLKEELTQEQYQRLQDSVSQAKNGEILPHEDVMLEAKTWLRK
jgi:hypothetical protein